MKKLTLLNILLLGVLVGSIVLANATHIPINIISGPAEIPPAEDYDPFADVNGPEPGYPDGEIDMRDVGYVTRKYGTQGDSSRNVTISNLSGCCGESASTFPQILKLRGIGYDAITRYGERYTAWELFDEDDTFPRSYDTMYRGEYGDTHEWAIGYNGTFVYEKPCSYSYEIHGNIRINLWYSCSSSWQPFTAYWRGNITLQKILPNGTAVLLAEMYSFDASQSHAVDDDVLVFPVSTPITINEGECIAVVFIIEFKWWADGGGAIIDHYFNPDTDEFLINLPIVP